MQCTVSYSKQPRTYPLTPSRKYIGKSLARRKPSAFAKEALKSEVYRKSIFHKVQSIISLEAQSLTSTRTPCTLRFHQWDSLTQVNWDALYTELSSRAPAIFNIMRALFGGPRSSQLRPKQKVAMCTAIAILLFSRDNCISLIQRIVSMILYAGHSSKSVSYKLNTLCACLHVCVYVCVCVCVYMRACVCAFI